jgi:uncharacterized protein YbjT (DUF2867 family)
VPVAVDLETGTGLEEALVGTRAAYHLAPNVHPDEVGMARRLAAAAARTDLPHLVFHSVLHPEDGRMPHHLRKAEAEGILRAAFPTRVVVLRPAAYHQNLVPAALRGELAVPYSLDAPFTTVDLDDVAEVAARVLLDPGTAGGVHDLAGPELLSTRRMADAATVALGRPVAARRLTTSEWLAGPGAGLDDDARRALLAMFAAYDDDGLVGDPRKLAILLGRPPTTWTQRLHAAAEAGAA